MDNTNKENSSKEKCHLQAAAEENLSQLQNDFISTVSHELRTPLTSIRGFAQTLIKYKDNLSEEQKVKFLTNIEEQSDRLIALVENLLASSVSKHEKQIFVCKSVNVKTSVLKSKAVISQKYPRKVININIRQDFPEIIVDSDKFEQILLNLIENACKYSYENTDVEITAKTNDKNEAGISVANEGLTISDKDKKKVFEKFSRLDNPMTRLTQGSGIGLFLASDLAQKMNGRIELESADGRTVFTAFFPIATAESLAQCKFKAVDNA